MRKSKRGNNWWKYDIKDSNVPSKREKKQFRLCKWYKLFELMWIRMRSACLYKLFKIHMVLYSNENSTGHHWTHVRWSLLLLHLNSTPWHLTHRPLLPWGNVCATKSQICLKFPWLLSELACCCSDVDIWANVIGYCVLCNKAERAALPLTLLLLWIEQTVNSKTLINHCCNRVCLSSQRMFDHSDINKDYGCNIAWLANLHVCTGRFLNHVFVSW